MGFEKFEGVELSWLREKEEGGDGGGMAAVFFCERKLMFGYK